ncbi:radical SAM/SPASM domain-containing protein [Clostridium algidicarnis]|nr:radical SAM protein [Clostridium algidicarnis]MBU3203654.1 radical SAM protein [Clostridium algidicarnis]MBU3211808.1 radical SAM protein [Clostridium algidicarnis]MBU3221685.1 radical SAM protein [Clostridium algidicarnis]
MKEKRYVIRNENFGSLIYDSLSYDIFGIDKDATEILLYIKSRGISKTITRYKNEFEINDFINTLIDMQLIKDNDVNAHFVENPTPENNILSAPIKVFLTITERCNLSCKHCFGNFGQGYELELNQIEKILDELIEIGVFQISVTGGEPFIHEDILEILRLIRDKGFTSQLTTNGTILNKEIIDFLKINKMFRFSISLEGDELYHDYIRGEGNYKLVKENIKRLLDNNVNVGINTVLTSGNIDNIDKMLIDLYDIGIDNISISHIVPTGRTKKNKLLINNPLENNNKQKFLKVIEQIKQFALKTKKPQFVFGLIVNPDGIIQGKDMNIRNLIDIKRCGAGSTILTIKANGNIIPCIFLEEDLKNYRICDERLNIMEKSIIDVWNNSKMFNYVRSIGVCAECEICNLYKNNNCSGGCPVSSKYFTGTFEGKDEFCYIGG